MDIDWYGQACFRIREGSVAVVTDPHDRDLAVPLPRVRADIVTASYVPEGAGRPRGLRGSPQMLSSPGEYEIGEVFVTGIPVLLKKPDPPQRNVVFVYDFNGLTACHLGRIDDLLPESQIEALNDVDVLFIPIDSERTLTADQAAEIVQMIEPRIVIPMHFDPTRLAHDPAAVAHFMHAVGANGVATEETLRLHAGRLPEETQVVLLECKG